MDGLRAVSVLGVILYHFRIGCAGGYVGVDVFFVISGFLITNLILRRIDAGSFSLAEFWARRVRRLAPALVVMVLVCLVAAPAVLFQAEVQDLGRSAMAQSMLVANVYFWKHSGYFDAPSETKPLLHTWSLAVEEQFYLVYPLLLWAVCRHFRRTSLPWVLLLLAGGSLAGCIVLCGSNPSFNFYLLPTRAWEMLLGGLIVFVPVARSKEESSLVAEGLVLGGLAAIVWSMLTFTSATPFPGPLSLLPCVGAALVIGAGSRSRTLTGRLLELPAAVLTGKMSYSLYLWHFPLYVFVRHLVADAHVPSVQAELVAGTFVCGWLSWKFIETPFRRSWASLASRTLIAGWVAAAGFTFAVGAYYGAPFGRHDSPLASTDSSSHGSGGISGSGEIIVNTGKWVSLGMSAREYLTGDFWKMGPEDDSIPVSIVVNGDSHAMCVMDVLDSLCRRHRVRAVAATCASTIPFVGFENYGSPLGKDCERCQRAVIDYVRERKIPHVILVAFYLNYHADTTAMSAGHASMVPEMQQAFLATMEAYADTGATVWVLKQVPMHKRWVPHLLEAALRRGDDLDRVGLTLAEHRRNEAILEPIFEGPLPPHVRLLDPTPCFLDEFGICRGGDGRTALYFDDHHLTKEGAARLATLFEPIVADAALRLTLDPENPRRPAAQPGTLP